MQIELGFDPVEPSQAAFGEAPERLNAVDVGAVLGEGLLLVDADVLVKAYVHQTVVAEPTIRADHTLGVNAAPDHRPQRGLGAILDDLGVNLALALEDAGDHLLGCATSTQARQRAAADPIEAKVALAHFNDALEATTLPPSLQRDEQPEVAVKRVDGFAAELEQEGGLGGSEVKAEALQYFF